MKRFLTRWPYFPLLFVITTVFSFYITYHDEATLRGLLFSSIFALLLFAVIWLFFNFLIHDLNKSAIITFFSSTLIYTFQNLIYLLRKTSVSLENSNLLRFWFHNTGQLLVFCIILILILIFFFLVKKVEKINSRTILYLNVISVLFLCIIAVNGIRTINANREEKVSFIQYWQHEINNQNYTGINDSNNTNPDIYYIIVDGFARSDTLLNLYDIDNSDFVNALQSKGFFVANESYSNYTQTRSSLASSMNMMYLDEVSEVIGEDKSFYYPLYYMIDNSLVENTLRSLGYKTASFSSTMSYTSFSDWDVHYEPKQIPDNFVKTYISSTAASVFFNPLFFTWHRDTIEYIFDTLPLAGKREGPQFIFAHILCPHPPFAFNSDGTARKVDRLYTTQDANYFLSEGTTEEYRSGYANQVVYLQEKLIELVTQIIDTSEDPFILIIQADHGSGMYLDQGDLANTDINERLGILNAIYFYDQDYEKLYDQISPVNTFRVVFSQYFGIDKPLLEDEHYYSKYWEIFDFIPVNNLLK